MHLLTLRIMKCCGDLALAWVLLDKCLLVPSRETVTDPPEVLIGTLDLVTHQSKMIPD